MSNLKNVLDELQPYVTGIKFYNEVTFLEIQLKQNWKLIPSNDFVSEPLEGSNNHYILYSTKPDKDIDDLISYAKEIINFNIDLERKRTLLKEKVEELKELFTQYSYSKLKNLVIKFSDEEPLDNDFLGNDFISIEETQVSTLTNKKEEPLNGNSINQINNVLPLKTNDNSSECSCGPEEACSKCIDEK